MNLKFNAKIEQKNIRDRFTPIKCRLNISLPKYDSDWELMPMFTNSEEVSKIHEVNFKTTVYIINF